MSFNYILTSDTTFEAVDKINENFSGDSNIWSSTTGNNSIISINDTNNISSNDYSFAWGLKSKSNGLYSFAYGKNVSADGDYSFATGESGSSIGDFSFTSGLQTTAIGNYSFASGYQTTAIGDYSFASGYQTIASGNYSFASGYNSSAIGDYSFVYSKNSLITGDRSAIIGGENITGGSYDTVYVPSVKIDTVEDISSPPTKVLSIDLNGNVITKDLVIPSSFFVWNHITGQNINITLNNGYVSKTNGTYQVGNYNTFTMPTSNSSDFGKKIKLVSDESSVTRLYFPPNVYLSYFNDVPKKIDNKSLYLYEYEYIELTFFYYNSSNYFWVINNFVSNLRTEHYDFFKSRIQ